MSIIPQLIIGAGSASPLGATYGKKGTNFAVISPNCNTISVAFFDQRDHQICQVQLVERQGDIWFGQIQNVEIGTRYGYRATGEFSPENGLYFNPQKLLVDPYAKLIDRAFEYNEALSFPPETSIDTARMVPKSVVVESFSADSSPLKTAKNALIYELNVRGFSKLNQNVPPTLRGTIGALGHPSIVAHFVGLGVDVIELMPVTASIDERHLVALGLHNAWGYNPVCYFAPDPKLMPGGISDLRKVTDIYRAHGIAIVLDVVYNHTGESDVEGPILSFKGLDALGYYTHEIAGHGLALVNDAGCGNTLNCSKSHVQNLVLESLQYWVQAGGVSGFRFDLAPVLGRDQAGFSVDAKLLNAIKSHPLLSQCLLIAEPWDPGPGGYQLGQFGPEFAEWNDKYRDDVRGFWRGETAMLGALATRLAGSEDVFDAEYDNPARGVNFIAAHDGFTLRDLVSFENKHNLANGENNRDGHGHNLSWNNGVEGSSGDVEIELARRTDVRALLATLFLSRGNILLCAGDEMGRTQGGNNNAYAQDNEITWLDWAGHDESLMAFVKSLSAFRKSHPVIFANSFLTGENDVAWLHPQGQAMGEADWQSPGAQVLGMQLTSMDDDLLIWVNGDRQSVEAQLPNVRDGWDWEVGISSSFEETVFGKSTCSLPARSVVALVRARSG